MKRHPFFRLSAIVAALVLSGPSFAAAKTGPIKVGNLHSLSGTRAIGAISLKDVALMTIQEIDAADGLLGREGELK